MSSQAIWIGAYLLLPASIILLSARVPVLNKVQPVISCYLIGLLLGNLGILPEGILAVQDTLSSVAVAFSIPLMLFGVDVRSWTRLSPRAGLALLLAAVAIIVVASAGHFAFRSVVADSGKVSGLLVGVYTGGTPNLAAIASALQVESSLYVTVHTADLVVGGVYLLFVITVAKPMFSRVLPAFDLPAPIGGGSVDSRGRNDRSSDDAAGGGAAGRGQSRDGRAGGELLAFDRIFASGNRLSSVLALVLAAALVGASLGLASLFPADAETIVVILGLTTLSIGVSLIPRVGELTTSFKMGEYVILVFCVVVGSMADIREMLGASVAILGFVVFAVFGSFAVHLFLCRLFRVDVDTMLVTSTAAICSPPFVGMVAIALGNRRIIAAGITTGIVGYAVGNYLGITLSLLLP